MSRPALGAETQIALGIIDLTQTLTFAESPYPAITGEFEVIACTKDVLFEPATDQNKFLACGYNPAAQVIPDKTAHGKLSFEGHDFAGAEASAMAFNGLLCVARLRTAIDDAIVRTIYCNYYTPMIKVHAPDGDEVGSVSGEGSFAYQEIPE